MACDQAPSDDTGARGDRVPTGRVGAVQGGRACGSEAAPAQTAGITEATSAQDQALIQDAFRALTALAARLDPTTELYQFSPALPPRL
jgi:hypothetical protein